jgi:hypothetical protein
MTRPVFAKLLSANDTGATGSHQAGICVPKSDPELLAFFPPLDAAQLNPDCWLLCEDESGTEWRLRYIYYNNRLHGQGTRNEYRITHLTRFLKLDGAMEGDYLRFAQTGQPRRYRLSIERGSEARDQSPTRTPGVIRLSGWRRVH